METLKKLSAIDLNLLLVFAAVDKTRHVTEAAKSLGITQSALSHALNRLRDLLNDQLFVKSSNGMVPTPKGEKLSEPIQRLLSEIEKDVLGSGTFNPKEMERTIRVYASDLIEGLLIPSMLRVLEEEAPKVRILTRSPGFSFPKDELELGNCDLAIAGFFGDLPDGFYQQKLFSDSFICAVRKGHPRLQNKSALSLDAYCKERHILIAPGGELTGTVDSILKKKKCQRFTAAGLSSFMVSGWVSSQSDCVLTGPSRLIQKLSEVFPLKIYEPPLALPQFTIVQAWHERSHQDPGHQWFRAKVKGILQS